MKLNNKCTGECAVCLFKRTECIPKDGIGTFARASKDELIRRLSDDSYNNKEKQSIRVWLKVQHNYE